MADPKPLIVSSPHASAAVDLLSYVDDHCICQGVPSRHEGGNGGLRVVNPADRDSRGTGVRDLAALDCVVLGCLSEVDRRATDGREHTPDDCDVSAVGAV